LKVDLAVSGNPVIREMLARHPRVERVSDGYCPGIQFILGDWHREVLVGDVTQESYGLLEIIDNNPLVCADRASVPGPATTLALIALTPMAQARIIDDSPVMVVNIDVDEAEIESALDASGWQGGIMVHSEPVDLDTVVAATVMVAVPSSVPMDEIESLYAERFERSFFIRCNTESEWTPELVAGKPFALYRMSIASDSPNSLLTIRLLADRNGKCGAAQAIHAMNVMCWFEESLGIDG